VTPTAAALLRVLTGVADAENRRKGQGCDDGGFRSAPASMVGRPPSFTPRAVGIGAGTKDFVKHPNVVRLILGNDVVFDDGLLKNTAKEKRKTPGVSVSVVPPSRCTEVKGEREEPPIVQDHEFENEEGALKIEPKLQSPVTAPETRVPPDQTLWYTDRLTLLEANLDDITPEILSHTINLLLDNGAIDAWVQPIVMKKGRSAHTINCLCHSSNDEQNPSPATSTTPTVSMTTKLLEIIFRNTTTLGIRIHRDVERASLHRSFVKVQTTYGAHDADANYGIVNVKLGMLGKEVVSTKAEFDECRVISEYTGVPVKTIAEYATRKVHEH